MKQENNKNKNMKQKDNKNPEKNIKQGNKVKSKDIHTKKGLLTLGLSGAIALSVGSLIATIVSVNSKDDKNISFDTQSDAIIYKIFDMKEGGAISFNDKSSVAENALTQIVNLLADDDGSATIISIKGAPDIEKEELSVSVKYRTSIGIIAIKKIMFAN